MGPEEQFWQLAEPLIDIGGVTRSTMMGSPCLRVDGKFFASFERTHKQLIVKLPVERVAQLITMGSAAPFAPAGRTFRAWAAIPSSASESWSGLLTEAMAFVASSG